MYILAHGICHLFNPNPFTEPTYDTRHFTLKHTAIATLTECNCKCIAINNVCKCLLSVI